MLSWLARCTMAALGMLLGAMLGAWLGWNPSNAGAVREVWLIGGGLCGVVVASAVEHWRGERLVRWLREPLSARAPRDAGLFGELAYRMERRLRDDAQALEAERDRLRQFLRAIEASPNGVMLLDMQDRIDWCNAQAADHFGLDPRRDRAQKVTNLIRSPAFVAHLQSGMFDEPAQVPAPERRGTISVWVRPYGEGLKLVLSQDVTERERNETMRRDFVANVSHEIRTPLTVVAGFVETMLSLPLDESERRHVLELMAQQTSRMQALVADLLQLAQLEGSPRPPTDQWLPLGKLLAKLELEARSLSAGRHRLAFERGAEVEIAGSESELHSAVANLLSNAVRYTPAQGEVRLRWQTRSDGSGEIEVADSGPGIAREHLGRLTERFYRVETSRSRESGGTGLGLAIVKHVMQRHGGAILIDSEPGAGSRFKLVFPASRWRELDTGTPGEGATQGDAVRA